MRRIAMLLVALLPSLAMAKRMPQAPFEPALAAHLAAIPARDLPALLATVAEEVTLILPSGKLVEGKAAFRALHEEWFAERGWTMSFKELRRTVTRDLALVLVETDYREGDQRARNYLTLVWKRIGNRWLLVHDQNTRLPPPAP
jgi:uncharacterized protein (TIGR02246 family)